MYYFLKSMYFAYFFAILAGITHKNINHENNIKIFET